MYILALPLNSAISNRYLPSRGAVNGCVIFCPLLEIFPWIICINATLAVAVLSDIGAILTSAAATDAKNKIIKIKRLAFIGKRLFVSVKDVAFLQ